MHATTRQAMFILAALAADSGSASPLHIDGTFAGVAVQAAMVNLGEVTAPLWWPIEHVASLGPFVDRFNFTIGEEESLMFSSAVTTGFSRRASISDFRGKLFRDGVLFDTGDSGTTYLPEGFPAQFVNFDPLLLGRGDYELRFSGTAYSFDSSLPIRSGYDGFAEFREVAQAVPEPSTMWLAALGITALLWPGFTKRRLDAGWSGP